MDEFEINIAKSRNHWARVILPLGTSDLEANTKVNIIHALFPASDDWQVSMTCWNRTGKNVRF